MDINALTKRSAMRLHTSNLDDTDLKKMCRHIEFILSERAEMRKSEAAKATARTAETLRILSAMEAAGVTLDDLSSALDAKQIKRPLPRYRTVDDSGRVVTWSGLGRPPAAIAKKLKAGVTKESMLIEPVRLVS